MKFHFFTALICIGMFAGCATYTAQKIVPTPITHAQQEISEDLLLDLGIELFNSEKLNREEAKKEETLPGIRKSEGYYIPYHLKNTLQQSSHWGMVRIIPPDSDSADVVVKGNIIESNGEKLILKIHVVDSSGKTWMRKTYKLKLTEAAYRDNQLARKDAFQDLYNTIANDMAAHKDRLETDQVKTIRTISKLRFAGAMAPDAFENYLKKTNKGTLTINRLPADEDPMMKRLLRIRERDYMFVDTLNGYYENFYNEMWPSYDNWRKMNLTERNARSKIRREAFLKQAAGALLVATAIILDAKNVNNTGLLKGILVASGGAIFINGVNVSKQSKIHAAAIEELGESFGSEMKPIVMEFEGKQYELNGSAENQYKRWRELLQEIYFQETGFDKANEPAPDKLSDHKNIKPAEPLM